MRYVLCLLLALISQSAFSVEKITVEALFTDKAMVKIDGVRRLLILEKPSPEGVLLISANSREAIIEINGERQAYALGSHVSTSYSQPESVSAKVWRDASGAYTTVGSINGLTVDFLVDTGASAVALEASEAKRLGIPYKTRGKSITVNTAKGPTPAYDVILDRVQVGDITLTQVRGFVIEGVGSGKTLLGMSFLNRVTMEDQGTLLLLHKPF